jgi:hypothetical protein
MADLKVGEVSLERMVKAGEKVRERLLRAAKALEAARLTYAVAGAMPSRIGCPTWMKDGSSALLPG